jgi:hypothetical protein
MTLTQAIIFFRYSTNSRTRRGVAIGTSRMHMGAVAASLSLRSAEPQRSSHDPGSPTMTRSAVAGSGGLDSLGECAHASTRNCFDEVPLHRSAEAIPLARGFADAESQLAQLDRSRDQPLVRFRRISGSSPLHCEHAGRMNTHRSSIQVRHKTELPSDSFAAKPPQFRGNSSVPAQTAICPASTGLSH